MRTTRELKMVTAEGRVAKPDSQTKTVEAKECPICRMSTSPCASGAPCEFDPQYTGMAFYRAFSEWCAGPGKAWAEASEARIRERQNLTFELRRTMPSFMGCNTPKEREWR